MYDRNDTAGPESTATGGQPNEQCSVCEHAIETTEWYPIRGQVEDVNFSLYTFCSEECLETWENSESNDAE
ncbi:DUF7576 family protein [Halosimplex salinum]|uniref:DUF7576 family protein n=1 Tax=Halosimplex salinum TaxID=1710538 RepID=UPI000F4AA2D2|nr:hypothetical protein [Halosimplex salinum]